MSRRLLAFRLGSLLAASVLLISCPKKTEEPMGEPVAEATPIPGIGPPVGYNEIPPTPHPSGAPDRLSRVWLHYGTNRAEIDPAAPQPNFGGARAEALPRAQQLQYGKCLVTLPYGHERGELEGPTGSRRVDPRFHVAFRMARRQQREEFLADIQGEAAHEGRQALVFVHGFNVSFEDAARRTAQMKYDLKFKGPALFFTWPSEAHPLQYVSDAGDMDWSKPHLVEFLHNIAATGSFDSIHLIAHSMGTRGATAALIALAAKYAEDRKLIHDVILAAPDIDAGIFVDQIAPELLDPPIWVTIYASSRDSALMLSRRWAKAKRLGDTNGGPVLVDGTDVIDATTVATGFEAHSVFGREPLLEDIGQLFQSLRPDDRRLLQKVTSQSGIYWQIQASNPSAARSGR